MTIGDRLRLLREARQETLDDVSKFIGVTRQTLYKYEAGIITNIPSDRIEMLARHYRVNPGYIMGWSPSRSRSYHLDQIKESFREMSDLGKDKVVTYADDLNRSGRYRKNEEFDMEDYIESYSIARAAAGTGSFNDEDQEVYHKLAVKGVPYHYDAQIDVQGSSMEPTIMDGDVAFLRFNFTRKNGDIYVIQIGDDTLIKRCYFNHDSVILRSDNEEYEDRVIGEDDQEIARIVAQVVGSVTPMI